MNPACIIGISAYSGSGKTTLIEKILPLLKRQGLSVGIIKHSHHKLSIDVKGKDTDRFFRAGADYVFAHDAEQVFMRSGYENGTPPELAGIFPRALDLIIVEGHKEYALPGIWLEKKGPGKGRRPELNGEKEVIFRDDAEHLNKVLSHIHNIMEIFHKQRIINAGLLVGGKSVRMGSPKALLKLGGQTLASRSFDILAEVSSKALLLGSGQMPGSLNGVERLPDVAGLKGPLSGMLSAFRWAPDSAWIISSVDMPLMHKEAWEWLLSQRTPGVWAILPKIRGSRGVETTGAVYEPMIFEHLESLARKGTMKLQEIARHPKVSSPLIPKSLIPAWNNTNTPAEWQRVLDLNARQMPLKRNK
jgi:molybdopterin-guanine dinucleotide biosynthesis protein MobB